MRIIQKTPNQLIVSHSPIGIWISCVFGIVVGAILLVTPFNSPEESLGTQITAFILIAWSGIQPLTSFISILWTFDKSDSSFLAEYKTVLTIKTLNYDLTEIKGIQIESESDDEGTETFGIKIKLGDKQELHLSPNFRLSEFTAKDGVRRISSFLEL